MYTKKDYPDSWKNMYARVRYKAIDIANALLEKGRKESVAIPIATDKAKEWAKNRNIEIWKKS